MAVKIIDSDIKRKVSTQQWWSNRWYGDAVIVVKIMGSQFILFRQIFWFHDQQTAAKKKQPAEPKPKKQPVEKKKRVSKKQASPSDGEKNKRPVSGFIKFSQENRAKVKGEYPGLAFGEVGRKLGEMWNALSEEQKQVYKVANAA